MILTLTTGIIDAVSFVGLGQVFTANMTGNVVFIGFALAGAEGFSVERSLIALGAFATGALSGGLLTNRRPRSAASLLAVGAAVETALLLIAAGVAFGRPIPPPWFAAHSLIVLTAVAIGLRTAIVRKLGVADITTTVLTLTITGLAADSSVAGEAGTHSGRRAMSIAAMFMGALAGTLMLRTWGFAPPLTMAAGLAAVVSVTVVLQSRTFQARSSVPDETRV